MHAPCSLSAAASAMDGGGAAAVSCTHRHRHSGLAAGPSVRDRSFQKTYSAGQQRCGRGRCEREEKGAEKEERVGERGGAGPEVEEAQSVILLHGHLS